MKLKLLFLLFAFTFLLNSGFTQNVGIGTSTPVAKLHINDSINVNTIISLTNVTGSLPNQANIALKNSSLDDRALQFQNVSSFNFPDVKLYSFLNID